MIKTKLFNLQVFLELLSCLSFSGIIFYLLKSNKYLNYVTPRMKPYFYFTIIIMLIWTLIGFIRLFQPQYRMKSAHCLVLLIPLLFLSAPHKSINTAGFCNKYFNKNRVPLTENTETSPHAPEEENLLPQHEFSDVLPGLDEKLKTITVSNEDFGFWISEININPQKYVDYKIKMTGFVYMDPDTFQEDEFMTSRLLMTCCVADLSTVGLICKYDNASQLKSDSWVTVEGVLITTEYEYNNQTYYTPEITVTNILPTEEVTGYVYSY